MKPVAAVQQTRRQVLSYMVGAAALPLLSLPELAEAAAKKNGRLLAFDHLHTGEKLAVVYRVGGHYVPQAMHQLQHLTRDFRTGGIHRMDPNLYDLLWHLRQDIESDQPFEIISAYRSPQTNQALRARRGQRSGVATRSLHMDGQAMDIAVGGVALTALRDAALDLKAGGVGYYPEGFIHVDTGRVRRW
ncbi:Bacterial protein of unknown function (DUF882) [gamma proteobacterium HdN1]|nr:Bacterial protein of unknown function (DUF882) [gamma proteobacterium HdN1]